MLPSESSMVVVDPSGFGAGFGELVSRGLNGQSRDLVIVPENPRNRVLDMAISSLRERSTSHDALLRALDSLAECKLSLNGQAQAQLEQGLIGHAVAFQDLTLLADRTFFRSFHDLERAAKQYGYRPLRSHVFTPLDETVPEPHGTTRNAGYIAVWSYGASAGMVEAFRAACFDVRTPMKMVACAADAAPALQSASAIVALTENPGTVYALARFGKPLCAPVCGATEIVENLCEFQPWHRVQIVDALLVALGGKAAIPRDLGPRGNPNAPDRAVTPKTSPLVSVVMPTFSRPNTLRDGLQRLQKQTYSDIEVIVVNNAGTPVDDVVAPFSNARLINRTENTGNATRPRNDGIAAARGEYIMFLDDDDVLFPEHIERMVAILERTGRDAAYSDFLVRFIERAEDGTESLWGWDVQKPFGITSYEMLVANRLGYFTVFMRRSLIDRIGAFAEEVLGGEEVEYWLRIAKHADFVHVAQPTSAYTVVRDWRGQLSEKSHALYAGGYEMVYERYPADDLPLVQQARAAYVASLRSTEKPPPMQPRYVLTAQ